MSSQDRYEDDVCYDAREPCSSGRAQRRSIHVRACRGPKDWRTDICDNQHLFKPINYDGKARPIEKRIVQSKRSKRRANYVNKPIPKGYYGYEKKAIELEWEDGGLNSMKRIRTDPMTGQAKTIIEHHYRHPVHKYANWYETKPAPITVYKWVSTAK